MRILGTAASGLRAQQVNLDTVANNMANVNTPGYKTQTVNFEEALAQEIRPGNAALLNGMTAGQALDVGAGVLYSGIGTDFRQGTVAASDRALDLAIEGEGFFQVRTAAGAMAYTRAGMFQADSAGHISDSQGNLLEPPVTVNTSVSELSVSPEGIITGIQAGQRSELGRITLARFPNPEGLTQAGDNLFLASAQSGPAQTAAPGAQGFGVIRSQALEQSNVELASAMTDMLQAQRAYQVNARLLQDGDKMWSLANSLRR